ncbi:MAG TPA: 4Fe-4S ferredoxin [Verrucomicrobiae bacterium]|nr:4Fe-4S ferredoxin [Verrucomicrobiae bacterium]
MSQWVINGLRTGIKTTVYPRGKEHAAGVTPGLPRAGIAPSPAAAAALVDGCPTKVFSRNSEQISADSRRCIHCFRCLRDVEHPANWEQTYEWATARASDENKFIPAFNHSIHICVVDTGDCGACLNEVRQLNNPYYNIHRLGFFVTPSPRHADVLLVVGTVTDHMRIPLQKIYDAMPTPKRVLAVGACALTGGIFADSFVSAKGLADILPVDVEVPGNPPPPLAILHGLLVAVGRKSAVVENSTRPS